MKRKKFKKYYVYENGTFLNQITKEICKERIDIHGYKWVGGEKVHRVIASLFIPIPDELKNINKICVNHKDGNKLNNHVNNLEWCTYKYNNYHARKMGLNNISLSNSLRWKDDKFRKRTAKNISKGLLKSGITKFKNNGRFKHLVTDKNGNEYTRQELSKLINKSISYTDTLIRKASKGIKVELFIKHGIKVNDIK